MTLDLAPIKRRVSFAPEHAWYTEDLAALVAEVERLRAHRELCTENLLKGYETGKAEERETVVGWLRRGMDCGQHAVAFVADHIERGDHRNEEEKP